jgi:pyruvate ferredoxin oxidoreductase delta subunit
MKDNKMKFITPDSTYDQLTPGGMIYASGNAECFNTGDWRVAVPAWIEENCKQCLLCVPVCPDSSIPVTASKRSDFDFEHCKGCGICFKVCPFKAITYKKDGE